MRLLKRIQRRIDRNRSYAQCGEDVIAETLLAKVLRIERPTYLDIGANHPVSLSNTYLFYRRGCFGVCVEPNPLLHAEIHRKRPRDVCLNVGVAAAGVTAAPFYVLDAEVLSTFSKEECDECVRNGYRLREVLSIPLVDVNELIVRHFSPWPNFVSLDTEGFDLAILRAIDFSRFRPEVFCVETVQHTTDEKIAAIRDVMIDRGYVVYADTYINTIFVDGGPWSRRPRPEGGR